MKKSLLFGLALVATFCSSAFATPETRYTDSLYFFGEIPNLQALKGAPDQLYAEIPSKTAGLWVLQAYFSTGGGKPAVHTLLQGATLDFYGEASTDTSRYVLVTFVKALPNGAIQYQSTAQRVAGAKTTLTLDRDYTYIEFSTILDETTGSNGYNLDAVSVNQEWPSVSVRASALMNGGVVASYPNPFLVSEAPTFNLEIPVAGSAELLILDITGKEAHRLDLGYQSIGSVSQQLAISTSGTYLAQLLVDGRRVGRMLKISGR